ncbi:MAG: response regulator transcription factor [Thermomicrobiales bacterium]
MRKRMILIVDDEPAIARLARAKLVQDGYAVTTVTNGTDALSAIEHDRPDLVVLDVMMPGMDGFEVLRRIRASHQSAQLPVILLTARTSDTDKLLGLHGGADDYMTKPFNPDELSARVAAIIRRSIGAVGAGVQSALVYPASGDRPELRIDLEQRRITLGGDEVRLSRTEWELLTQLAGNAGRVMLHAELLSRIWGPEFRDEVQYLRTWVSRIRTKLEPGVAADASQIITTFPGLGYRMEQPASES